MDKNKERREKFRKDTELKLMGSPNIKKVSWKEDSVNIDRKERVVKNIKPLRDVIFVTAEKLEQKELVSKSGIILGGLNPHTYRDIQQIIFIGDSVTNSQNVQKGDWVKINWRHYAQEIQKRNNLIDSLDEYYDKEYKFHYPVVKINEVEYLRLNFHNDIEYIVTEFEDIEENYDKEIDIPEIEYKILKAENKVGDIYEQTWDDNTKSQSPRPMIGQMKQVNPLQGDLIDSNLYLPNNKIIKPVTFN